MALPNVKIKQVPLISGAYQYRGVIASAQRCVNLYPESNIDPQAPVPVTHWPTPGTELFGQVDPVDNAKTRCTYRASNGNTYVVVGPKVYFLASNRAMVFLGAITDRPSQVYMSDNGLAVVLVDGVSGWAIDLVTNAIAPIIDPAFYGADYVVFLDTFFVFNRPNTNQFYISLSMVTYSLLTAGTSFDPLDIAAKAGSADVIVGISTTHRELWLIGELTTEVWIGTGSADFYFQQVQGAYINHGCGAQYSITSMDILTFWLMQDLQGKDIIVKGSNYQVSEISTPAIVNAIGLYETTADAIGFCYQQSDHAFYVLTFPTANKTWAYEVKTEQWHEWNYYDPDTGTLNRHRANCSCFAYGKNLIGDHEYGIVWSLEAEIFTDGNPTDPTAVVPILRIRTFPHLLINLLRVEYLNLQLDMTTGTLEQATEAEAAPEINLRWSDDKGATYGNYVVQTLGRYGQFSTQVSYWRLGMARDRVFEISWSSPIKTSFNSAFLTYRPLSS